MHTCKRRPGSEIPCAKTIRLEGPNTHCRDLEVEQTTDALPHDALCVHSGNRYNCNSHTRNKIE